MSKFSMQHYKVIAEVIKDWNRINPDVEEKHVDSLVTEFIIAFKADNNKFDRYEFAYAVMKERR